MVRPPPGRYSHRAYRRLSVRLGRDDAPRTVVSAERTLVPASPAWRTGRAFWDEAFRSALRASHRKPYLSFAIRTDAVIDEVTKPVLRSRLDEITDGSARDRLAFVRPDTLLEAWTPT
jgi:hypothetical protein